MSQERFESDRHLSHHRVVVTTFFARSSCHSPQKCMSAKNAVSRSGDTYCRLCPVSGIKYRREPSHPRLRQRSRCGSRSEEHTSELQSLMRISYAVFCLKKKNTSTTNK